MMTAEENISDTGSPNNGKQTEDSDEPKDQVVLAKRLSKGEVSTLVTLALSNFFYGAGVSLHGPFFPPQAESKGISTTMYGLIMSFYPLAIFITAPAFMKLATIFPAKFILCNGLFIVGACEVLFGILDVCPQGWPYITLAFLIRFMDGVGAASLQTSTYIVVYSQFKDGLASMHTAVNSFLLLGLILGPILGGVLYDANGFGLPFYVLGVLTMAVGICAIFLIKEPESKQKFSTEKLGLVLKDIGVLVYSLVIFSSFAFVGFLLATLEPHLRTFQLSGVFTGLIFSIPAIMYCITAPGWKWLTDGKFHNLLIADVACSIVAASLILIGPVPFIHREPTLNFAIAALFLKGIGVGGKSTCSFYGALEDVTSKEMFEDEASAHGMISSICVFIATLGIFVGSSFGGYIFSSIGFAKGCIILLSLEAITMILVFLYAFKRKYRRAKISSEKQPILAER